MGKILVIADMSKRCYATPRGLELARRLGHSTEVVAFVWAPLKSLDVSAAEKARIKQQLLNDREAEIEDRVAREAHDGQDIAIKIIWSKDVVPWVLRRTTSRKYVAVVKTGQPLESPVSTPTDWQLLRECRVPVMIVAREKWLRTKPVLAAVDLGTRNKQKRRLNTEVITRAKRIADSLSVELELIAAVEVPTLLSDLDIVDPASYVRQQKQAMRGYIRELAEAHELPPGAFRVKRGPVAKVITSEAARVRAQLVVMGTVGRKGVKARLLGNTAESVLELLHTDVLALKP